MRYRVDIGHEDQGGYRLYAGFVLGFFRLGVKAEGNDQETAMLTGSHRTAPVDLEPFHGMWRVTYLTKNLSNHTMRQREVQTANNNEVTYATVIMRKRTQGQRKKTFQRFRMCRQKP